MKIYTHFRALLGGLCLGGAIGLGGCCSLEATKSEVTGETHALIINRGSKLFNWIPLYSGNATLAKERWGGVAFFRDDVKEDKLLALMQEYATDNKLEIKDLNFHRYSTVLLEIPLFGVILPIPYIVCSDELQLSGVMK